MFLVRWERTASDELAELWLQADSTLRQAITASAHVVDERLRQDPLHQGESREGAERVWFVFPLGVLFDVDEQRSLVSVLHVWVWERRGK